MSRGLQACAGCELVQVRTASTAGASPTSSRSGGAAATGRAAESKLQWYAKLYDKAHAAGASSDTPKGLRVAWQAARQCVLVDSDRLPAGSAPTSNGEKTATEMHGECLALQKSLWNRTLDACGFRNILITSDIMADGKWTPLAVSTPRGNVTRQPLDKWEEMGCDDLKENPAPLKEIAHLGARVIAECKQPGALAWFPSDWSYVKNDNGVIVQRFAMAQCRYRGRISGWYLE
jgi:hypothetical protein